MDEATKQAMQQMIAQTIAQTLANQAPAPAPARDYFTEADELTKRANEIRKEGVARLDTTSDETFAVIRESVVSGIQCEESKRINKKGGTKLSDDQIADRKEAQQEHKDKINASQFKADLSALVGADETELQSFKQSLPNKDGKVKRVLTF